MSEQAITNLALSKYVERDYEEIDSRKGWIDYGDDNLFPEYLISLYNGSAVHNALVNSIAYMIFGEGVQLEGESQLLIEKWGLNDELLKASVDLKLQGGFYLEVSWSLDRSHIKSVRHIPFEEFRAGYMSEDGNISTYYHCLNWEEVQKMGYTEVKAFNPDIKNEYPVQILACKPFTVGSHYYPKPDYMGSINWIEVDKQIAVFHNNNIANGMAPSFAINWKNGVPPKLERDEIKRDIEAQMTGAKNAGKFFMTFSPRGGDAPDFEPFALSDAHNQYQFLSDESTNKIMIGHRVTTPAMFGVKTAGQLGSTDELKVGSMLFERNVIMPYQKIIRKTVNRLLVESGVNQQAEMITKPLMLKKEIPNIPYLSSEQGKEFLSKLKEVGEKVSDDWELVDESEVDAPEQEYKLHLKKEKFFSQYADPDSKSKVDTGLYKIRYRYSQNISDDSREFCTIMVEESKAKTVYKFEDIIDMGDSGVNGQFAPEGEKTYSIWLWKGGSYCHHKWVRQVYFRKRTSGGQFKPNKGLKNDKLVEGTPDIPLKEENFPQANTRPIDTPKRGSLKNK